MARFESTGNNPNGDRTPVGLLCPEHQPFPLHHDQRPAGCAGCHHLYHEGSRVSEEHTRAPQGHRQLPMTCDTTLFSFLSCSAPPRAEVLRSSSPAPGSLTLASSEPLWPLSVPSLVPTSDSSPPWTAVLTSGSCLERVLFCAPPALSFVGGVGSAHVLSLRLGF